ncbi:MAG: 3-keto-5-aminohexanoate cleavage protein [Actinobacteria bacterium HGW-Actinobacteria-7]|nr:MAG: 3-keto-5-aminohexanoate cleavage protein [Actinobacteria bacterium HGW-Actinobacteria-7]
MPKPSKTIINLAPVGMIPTKAMSEAVPITPAEIIDDVKWCVPLGVSMVHLHARDAAGAPTPDGDVFARIIGGIRETHPDLVVTVTTSGRTYSEFEERSAALRLEGDLKPDMASLTLSSVNFNRTASMRSPDMIMRLAEAMQSKGIKPELEVFDLGMVNYAHYLIKKGLLEPPYFFNIILGNIAAAQARLHHLGIIVSELPDDSFYCVAGIGDAQLDMNALGLIMGNGARVGLEDNIWYDQARTVPASNASLVERVAGVARSLEREVATAQDVRGYLDLPSR